ncbi:MAG: RraA family protein [Acidimicrobiia bacterium]|nr:RraA family protein [Acidimicrobiia bacterium]
MRKRLAIVLLTLAVSVSLGLAYQAAVNKAASPPDALIAGFDKSTVASVADAVDQVVGRRGFMSHDVRPYVAGKFVGRAATALVRPAPPEKATPALAVKHSVEMIDAAQPGEVGIIVMEGSRDVAAIGGLMGTAAKARGMAGMVLDGSVRDIAELRGLGLPVFARGATPATAVGRYASVARNVPVECGGVMVTPGDIIVAGEDGVVVVPQTRAADVLKLAQEIDARESKMVPFIQKFKSLSKAIEVFNRI